MQTHALAFKLHTPPASPRTAHGWHEVALLVALSTGAKLQSHAPLGKKAPGEHHGLGLGEKLRDGVTLGVTLSVGDLDGVGVGDGEAATTQVWFPVVPLATRV
jgi:hypothetical protein